MDATNLESLAEKMFEGSDTDAPGAGEENLREAAEEMVEPTQDAESEIIDEVEEDEDFLPLPPGLQCPILRTSFLLGSLS